MMLCTVLIIFNRWLPRLSPFDSEKGQIGIAGENGAYPLFVGYYYVDLAYDVGVELDVDRIRAESLYGIGHIDLSLVYRDLVLIFKALCYFL